MAVPTSPYRVKEKSGWAIADPTGVRRRVLMCLLALALAFFGLLLRLWYLQVVRGASYLAQAQVNRTKKVPLSAPRGLITDRNGVVLATSRVSHSVAIVPAALPSQRREPGERLKILQTLGFLIKATPAQIEKQLEEAQTRGGRPYDPVRVGGDVGLKTLTLVEENKLRLGPAVLVTNDITRFYPNGSLASHVLGYSGGVTERDLARSQAEEERAASSETTSSETTSSETTSGDASANNAAWDDVIGKNGVEREYDGELAGIRGSEQYEVDARGRPVHKRGEEREKAGKTLVLTLDARLQRAAEKALDAARNSGAVAAIDPRSGEVLALASRPAFDPNIFSLPKADFQKRWLSIDRNPKHPLINRAVTSRFPPGSTYKMITAAAGLEQGSLSPSTTVTCTGGYYLGKHRFGCWKTHGTVDLMGAIAGSCDVYFYKAALAMGNPEGSGPTFLARISRQFGLGLDSGIDLPVDSRGLMPDPAWRRAFNAKRPALQRWYPGNTLNMSIGQGDVLVTPLQMALATGAVANGGTLWKPHLMRAVRQNNGDATPFKPQGPFATMPVAVAGKTGSAEDDANGTAHAWFTCFAPYDPTGRVKPRIAIAVIIENSGHGSENAAPVARKILDAAFPTLSKSPLTRVATSRR